MKMFSRRKQKAAAPLVEEILSAAYVPARPVMVAVPPRPVDPPVVGRDVPEQGVVVNAGYSRAEFDRFRSMVLRGDVTGVPVHGPMLVKMWETLGVLNVTDPVMVGLILADPNQTRAVQALYRIARKS